MDAVPTAIAGQAGHVIGMALGLIPAAISALTVTPIIIGTAALRVSGEALGDTAVIHPTTAVCPTAPGNNQADPLPNQSYGFAVRKPTQYF